jgi:Transposase
MGGRDRVVGSIDHDDQQRPGGDSACRCGHAVLELLPQRPFVEEGVPHNEWEGSGPQSDLVDDLHEWWPHILEFIHTGISNATSEGINRVVKLEARKAYGFRNPENQRLRTRSATTRRTRGHLQPA